MKAELNQEAVDNEVFSKAVKVNAVALSAVKSFLEVSKVLGVHRSTIISWRNNITFVFVFSKFFSDGRLSNTSGAFYQ